MTVAKYIFFSQVNLKSHQIPILLSERKYTAFEACGTLYQFTRIPFGVANGVTECPESTFACLDDVTVWKERIIFFDTNLQKFMNAVSKYRLTLN